MSDAAPADRSDTQEAIMAATYRALHKHGYANLTTQAIADEFDMTKAVLHYHYDTKDDLLAAFLEYLLDRFASHADVDDHNDPRKRLLAIVDRLLFGRDADNESSYWEFQTAMLAVRAQAPYIPDYREQFAENYAFVHETVAGTIADGIDQGIFRDDDPERLATLVLSTIQGARTNRIVLDDPAVVKETHEALVTYFDAVLVRDGADGLVE